jgi:DNA-binding beta-propeller fold protein YncE
MKARSLILATLCAIVGGLALSCAPSLAALTHPYVSQLTGFGDPTAVTVGPGGDLYVADSGSRAVDRYDSSAAPLSFSAAEPYVEGSRLTGTPSGPFELPQGVAVNNATGEIYVADGAKRVVDAFKASGEYLRQLTGAPPSAPVNGSFRDPSGLTVDQSTGELYVTDPQSGVVDVFNAADEYVSQFGSGLLGGSYGESVAVDDLTGDVYVGDSATDVVYPFNSLNSFTPPEWHGTETPAGSFGGGYVYVGIDQTSGHVYVATTQSVVDEFAASGSEEYVGQVTGTPAGLFGRAQAVSVDPSSGEVYVADGGADVVDVFGPPAVLADVSTGAATGIATTSVTLEGAVDPDEVPVSGCELEYRTDAEASFAKSVACTPTTPFTGKATIAVSASVAGLQPNTAYEYRLAATNANGTAYGSAQSFTTLGPPAVEGESASAVSRSHAELSAQVDPHGLATHYRFEYGPSTSYGTSIPIPDGELAAGFGAQPVSVEVTGLTLSTTYHYRVVASNAGGTVDGPDESFQTLPAVLIDSESATNVAGSSATLEAQVDPLGSDTTAYFQYGAADCSSSPAACVDVPLAPGVDLGAGEGDQSVSAHLQGLTPGVTYHYRVLVANALGTSEGADRTFATQAVGGASALPDGRAWEMVTPPYKQGSGLVADGNEQGADNQAAADGSAITYGATSPFVVNPAGSRSLEVTQVFSDRKAPGDWETNDISTAHDEGATSVAVGHSAEYKLFSSDLSFGLVEPEGDTPLPPLPAGSEKTLYLREADGGYRALVTTENVAPGVKFGGNGEGAGAFDFNSATPDFSHVVLHSSVGLTSTPSAEGGLYVWHGGELELASVLPGGAPTQASLGQRGELVRHAISNDGSRLVFEARSPAGLYLRDMAKGETIQVDAAQGVAAPESADSRYETADESDSRVFFTSPNRLTADSTALGEYPYPEDLYEFEVTSGAEEPLSGRLSDLTVDRSSGQSADVQGVIGASEDGSYVYFVAKGILGDGGERGAEAGADNLYSAHFDTDTGTWGAPVFIALLSSEDHPSWSAGFGVDFATVTSRVSPNGRYLAFMSDRSLTGYDNRDASSGVRDEEVFLYDAGENRLVCASCNPTGARPAGLFEGGKYEENLVDYAKNWQERWLAANIPGWDSTDLGHALYQPRYLADSGRLFFNSSDALVPDDVNGKEDVYEYEPAGVGSCQGADHGQNAGDVFEEGAGGCVALISAGTSREESAFLDASETGGDVFFLTLSRLAPQDTDTSLDVYDAHECAESSPCAAPASLVPPPCTTGDACKAAPTPQPSAFGAPASATFSGAGNVAPAAGKAAVTTKRSAGRAQKLAKALKVCVKKPKRKRAACRAQARKRYRAKSSSAHSKAENSRTRSSASTATGR